MISCVTISRSAGLARNAQTPWRSGGIAVSFIAELKKMGEISETVTRKIAAASCEFDRRASVKKKLRNFIIDLGEMLDELSASLRGELENGHWDRV